MSSRTIPSPRRSTTVNSHEVYELVASSSSTLAGYQFRSGQHLRSDALTPQQYRHADEVPFVYEKPSAGIWNFLQRIMPDAQLKWRRHSGYATIATENSDAPNGLPHIVTPAYPDQEDLLIEGSDDEFGSNEQNGAARGSSRWKSGVGNPLLSADEGDDSDPPDNSL